MKAVIKISIAATIAAVAIGVAAWFVFHSVAIAAISSVIVFTGLTIPMREWRVE